MIGPLIFVGICLGIAFMVWAVSALVHNTLGRAGAKLFDRLVNRSNATDLERFKRGK